MKRYYKLVGVDINELEYTVVVDTNSDDLEVVHKIVKNAILKYPDAEWRLIPLTYQTKNFNYRDIK